MKQVKELEERLNIATEKIQAQFKPRLDSMEREIPITIEKAVQNSFEKMLEKSNKDMNELKQKIENNKVEIQDITATMDDTLTRAQRISDKISGDLKNADAKLDALQSKATTITNNSIASSDKAIKDYLSAKHDLQEEIENANATFKIATSEMETHLETYIDEWMYKKSPAPSVPEKPYKNKNYADEYTINGNIVQVRAKKFNEDATLIVCDSKDTLLIMYEVLQHVAQQYGIFLTSIKDLEPWNIDKEVFPPTFPFTINDFENEESLEKAYDSMSLAIANKLKTGVKFGSSFVAAQMAIDTYTTKGYIMLYDLMKVVHPKLLRNKAVRPQKPRFKGDLNKFITQYRNWIQYQLNRAQPHHHDDDEIADDIIFALKTSEWKDKLQKGIDILETKMDRWRAVEHTTFPTDLKLQFIAQTLISYYVERNVNPFETRDRRGGPAIRAFQTRGRSRTPVHRGRSRSPYYRRRTPSNSFQQSTKSEYEDREICGGQHKPSTKGCPHLYRQIKVNDYIANTNQRTIDKQMQEIDRHRSKSRSQSRESNSSRYSARSNSKYE